MELWKSPFLKVYSQWDYLLKTIWLFNDSKIFSTNSNTTSCYNWYSLWSRIHRLYANISFLFICVYVLIHICLIILIRYIFSLDWHEIWKLVLHKSFQNDKYLVVSKINLGIYSTMIAQTTIQTILHNCHLKVVLRNVNEKDSWSFF